MRLDKWLSNVGKGSRKDVKFLLKAGRVQVNGKIEKNGARHVNPDEVHVELDGVPVHYQAFFYYMLNKPPGVITATEDPRHQTVLDLIQKEDHVKGLFPVGRLDKDTEGLLLITNDGPLGHQLLSPKHHVEKTYEAIINGPVSEAIIRTFKDGIELVGEGLTQPAKLTVLEEGEHPRVKVVITEGKFHQIKRMFHSVGREVLFLKRTEMGSLVLDTDLLPGKYRTLTEDELEALSSLKD